MKWRRALGIGIAIVCLLLLVCILYLSFADLGHHKARIEALVTHYTGRDFAIEGDLRLRVFPTLTLVAERARFANASWGSKPQMVEVGHLEAEIDTWSLLSGPIDVRKVALSDVRVLLEQNRDGRGNWIIREPATDALPADKEESEEEPAERTRFPIVIEKAQLDDVRVSWRARGKPELLVRLDALTIVPGLNDLLGLDGRGMIDEYPISLQGEAGPIPSLLAGRDMQMKLKGSLGRLGLDVNGKFGDLDPLDGVDLRIKATGQDFGAMLARFGLPAVATGALAVDAKLKDAGKRTQFDLVASAGDLAAKANGTLAGLYLRGSDIRFDVTAADAARLARVFGVENIPAEPLSASGRVMPSRKEIRFEALKAQLAGNSAQLDGTIKRGRDAAIELRFDVGLANLANLRQGLPQQPLQAKGDFALDAQHLALGNLAGSLGENRFQGSFSMARAEPWRIEADLASPHLDLTPYLPQPPADPNAGAAGAARKSPAREPKPAHEKDRLLFTDTPLPIRQLRGTEAKIHLAVGELLASGKSLKDLDGTVIVDRAHVEVKARATGSLEGTVQVGASVEPTDTDGARLALNLGLENVRAGLDMKDMERTEVPPLSLDLDLVTRGISPREMATNANGHILVTQGAGKTKANFLNVIGGDVINQLRGKLNPFKAQDPFTQLDCTVVRADIVNGAVTVEPVLMQTQKVTVAAKGKLNLHDEHLTVDFDTRPRKGIGVSPGMFTNPFIRLEGTLMNPRIAVGGKGAASAGVAAATGGLSVIAGGFIDRLRGEANMCKRALAKATEPRKS